MQQIERGIFYEDTFLGVTVGGITFSHGTIMIDAPLRAEDARAWRSMLLNQRGGSNRLLVNLDSHPDRTLGARALDCTILAHQKTAQVFRNRPTIFKGALVESGSAWEFYPEAIGMRWAPPDITFTHSMSLHWGGPEVILEHHPGPTPGAIWAIIPAEKVLFVGDLVGINQPAFLAYGELEEWLEALDLLHAKYSDHLIISGRGGLVVKDAIQKQQQHIRSVLKGIEKLARRNSAPEDTEELLPGLLAEFSFDGQLREFYTQRLRFGLHQYYARRYRPTSTLEQPQVEEEEEQ